RLPLRGVQPAPTSPPYLGERSRRFAAGEGAFCSPPQSAPTNHRYVSATASRKSVFGRQPSAASGVESSALSGAPSGFVVSYTSFPRKPTPSATTLAASAMLMSAPPPRLIGASPS